MELGHFPSQTLPVSQDCGWNWSFVTAKNKTPLLWRAENLRASFFIIKTQKLWFSILIFLYCWRFFVFEIKNIRLTHQLKSTRSHQNAACGISGWSTKPPRPLTTFGHHGGFRSSFECPTPKEISPCRRSWRSLGSGWLNWQIFWKLPSNLS